jgi:hypothetical protein
MYFIFLTQLDIALILANYTCFFIWAQKILNWGSDSFWKDSMQPLY